MQREPKIRAATIEDAAAIARVVVETWQAAYRGQIPDSHLEGLNIAERTVFFEKELSRGFGHFLVAEEAGEVVGQCCVSPSRDQDAENGKVAEIIAIYVLPAFSGRGIGTALCRWAKETALKRGFKEMTLWTLDSNAPARRFYEARGFKLDAGTKMFKLAGGVELKEIRYRTTL